MLTILRPTRLSGENIDFNPGSTKQLQRGGIKNNKFAILTSSINLCLIMTP